MTYAISPAGFALIQDVEGFRAEPTRLPDGAWVIGHGHVRADEPGGPVTPAEAADLLVRDVAEFERLVNAHVTARLAQSQFDALVSFAFSVGEEAFVQSQVLRRVNNAEHVAAACALDAWRKAEIDGALEVVDTLVRRRAAEKALYLKDTAVAAAPSAFLRAKLDYAASVLGAPVAYAPTPDIETARPALSERPDACVRLAEILKSEPATEALLLTQVAPETEVEADDEIVTAHAKPAARKTYDEAEAVETLRDRRLAKMRGGDVNETLWDRLTAHLDFSQSFETVGLIALILFGVGLTLVGGSLVFGGVEDMLQVAGAAALMIPGLVAIAAGGWALSRGAPAPSRA
ncbi:MAG TPA: lysozyme [Terricaulis sp.]|nr:lysozyme [Terricaulis sp.]